MTAANWYKQVSSKMRSFSKRAVLESLRKNNVEDSLSELENYCSRNCVKAKDLIEFCSAEWKSQYKYDFKTGLLVTL